MATYCVSFTIDSRTLSGKTYDDRRQLLIDNVRQEDIGFWDGTTSFFFVESMQDTLAFARRAFSGLSEKDAVIVFDPSDMSAASFGAVKDFEVLKSFLPSLTHYRAAA